MLVTLKQNISILKNKKSNRSQKKVHHKFLRFLWIRNMKATNEDIKEDITDFFI